MFVRTVLSYYQYFCVKKSNVYITRIDHTRDSRLLVAACRMVLLAGRALSSGQCSVYAGIWCLEKAGYFYDRLCGYTQHSVQSVQSVDTGGSSAS